MTFLCYSGRHLQTGSRIARCGRKQYAGCLRQLYDSHERIESSFLGFSSNLLF